MTNKKQFPSLWTLICELLSRLYITVNNCKSNYQAFEQNFSQRTGIFKLRADINEDLCNQFLFKFIASEEQYKIRSFSGVLGYYSLPQV